MLLHVAVADPRAHYADEVTAILRSRGVSAEAPADLSAWADDRQVKVVLLTLATERDWERLAALRRSDERLLVVAVMEVADRSACAQALAAGAVSILPRGASPQAVLDIVGALSRGESVLPTPLVRALAQRQPTPDAVEAPHRPSAKELSWLRQLADGVTVRQLANSAGYSERMMFRILRTLYQRLHARTRTEALFLARERGWI